MPRAIVLGTGTGVGKTFVAGRLARALGPASLTLKPVETGCPTSIVAAAGRDPTPLPKAATPSDAATLAEFHVKRPGFVPRYAFADGVSPHLAARRAGIRIDVEQVVEWTARCEQGPRGVNGPRSANGRRSAGERAGPGDACWTVIETAGGVFSPLGPGVSNLDMAHALGPAVWILVARDALGVLHDVSAVLAAMSADRPIDFVVVNAPGFVDDSTGTNATELETLGIHERVWSVRRDDSDDVSALANEISRGFSVE